MAFGAFQFIVHKYYYRLGKIWNLGSLDSLFKESRLFKVTVVSSESLGCTPRGLCNRTLLRRVLRRFFNNKCFLESFFEGACKGFQSRQGS